MPPSKLPQEPAFGNPYEILGIAFDAIATLTPRDITKAYRRLALQLHPDKVTDASKKKAAEESFHQVTEAHAFLTLDEHVVAREAYRTALQSQAQRQEMEQEREAAMTSRRQQMQQDLRQREAEAERERQKQRQEPPSRKRPTPQKKKKKDKDDDERLEKIRRQTQAVMEEFASRQAQEETERVRAQRQEKQAWLQQGQVRLKWKRAFSTRLNSPQSIRDFLQEEVVSVTAEPTVELLGSRGTAALVTFQGDSSSLEKRRGMVKACVQHFLHHSHVRAFAVVGGDDDEEEATATKAKEEEVEDYDLWNQQRAAKREELLRQMEEQEDNEDADIMQRDAKFRRDVPKTTDFPYPPPFPPSSSSSSSSSPLEQLEALERVVLGHAVTLESSMT